MMPFAGSLYSRKPSPPPAMHEGSIMGHYRAGSIAPHRSTKIYGTAHGLDKETYDNKLVFLMGIEKARFRNPVIPNCKLELKIKAIRTHGRVWKYKGEAFVNEKKMADAQWSATIVDRK